MHDWLGLADRGRGIAKCREIWVGARIKASAPFWLDFRLSDVPLVLPRTRIREWAKRDRSTHGEWSTAAWTI